MMKKSMSILLAVIVLLNIVAPCTFAARETVFELPIDVNERYSEISEKGENEDLFGYNAAEQREKETKRGTYIAVLSVILVIAVVILVVTLRRVPKEEDIKIGKEENNAEDKKE